MSLLLLNALGLLLELLWLKIRFILKKIILILLLWLLTFSPGQNLQVLVLISLTRILLNLVNFIFNECTPLWLGRDFGHLLEG